jgi:hypothetical protein
MKDERKFLLVLNNIPEQTRFALALASCHIEKSGNYFS